MTRPIKEGTSNRTHSVLSTVSFALIFGVLGCETTQGGEITTCSDSVCVDFCASIGHLGGHCEGDMCVCTDEDGATDPGEEPDTDTREDPASDPVTDPIPDGDPLSDLRINVSFPSIIRHDDGDLFVVYLSHLMGNEAFASGDWQAASISVENTSSITAYRIRASVELAGYSTPAQVVDSVPRSGTVEISLTPDLDFEMLYALSDSVSGRLLVSVEVDGGPGVFSESRSVRIVPKNVVFIGNEDFLIEEFDVRDMSAVLATPDDLDGRVDDLVESAGRLSRWGMLGPGYSTWKQHYVEGFSLCVGCRSEFLMYLEAGETLDGTVRDVSGWGDDTVGVYILDEENFGILSRGGDASACFAGSRLTDGDTYSCTPTTAGWYYLVFQNPMDSVMPRNVVTFRYLSKEEVTRMHLEALFDEVHHRAMEISHVDSSYFLGSQYVQYPSETLAGSSGNCLEGSLVFASALEAIGMRPVLIFAPTHVLVGVYSWHDSTTILPVETTMVGGGDFWGAYMQGWEEMAEHVDAGDALVIDVGMARDSGVLPMPI